MAKYNIGVRGNVDKTTLLSRLENTFKGLEVEVTIEGGGTGRQARAALTDDDKAELIRMRKDGSSYQELAEHFKCSTAVINKVLKAAGMTKAVQPAGPKAGSVSLKFGANGLLEKTEVPAAEGSGGGGSSADADEGDEDEDGLLDG